jgi:hypothetical protein
LYRCSSDHRRKFDYSIKISFVFGYVVCATSAVVVFYILIRTLPWTYSGKRNKKIKISEMIVLMVRRKHKKTQDHQIMQFSYCGDSISVPLSQLCAWLNFLLFSRLENFLFLFSQYIFCRKNTISIFHIHYTSVQNTKKQKVLFAALGEDGLFFVRFWLFCILKR